jgi:hypothetical protein
MIRRWLTNRFRLRALLVERDARIARLLRQIDDWSIYVAELDAYVDRVEDERDQIDRIAQSFAKQIAELRPLEPFDTMPALIGDSIVIPHDTAVRLQLTAA